MIRRVLGLMVVLVAIVLAQEVSARTAVGGFRLGAHPDGVTRLVLDLGQSIEFRTRVLSDPARVVIDTDGLSWAAEPVVSKAVGVIRGLRYAEDAEGGHLTIDLRSAAEVKSAFVMSPRDGQGWRLVMDLKDGPAPAAKTVPRPVVANAPPPPEPAPAAPEAPSSKRIVVMSPSANTPPPAPEPPAAPVATPPAPPSPPPAPEPVKGTPPVPPARPSEPVRFTPTGGPMLTAPMPPPPERPKPAVMPEPQPEPPPQVATPVPAPEPDPKPKGDGRPVIVIDPGHGGVDPGAIGVSGMYEKYITLAEARELKAQLESTGRYHVHLTRDRDVFVRLRDRVQLARQYGADLFISLHADVVKDNNIRGLSVYTLSQNASDSEAQALADKENKADLIAGIDLSHEPADVANILIDLAQRETMNRSAGFAIDIVEELGRETSLLTNTHRFAGFAVLKAPDVPSVLIEMGYLSNDGEERSLRQQDYRAKLARAITHAVDRFFMQGLRAKR